LEDVLASIEKGDIDALLPHLAALGMQILPLLRLLDSKYHLDLPLEAIERELRG
jgi:hypothetical protein